MLPRDLLTNSFHTAVAAVRAERVLPGHLPAPPTGRTWVVGAGKAAAAMALTVERHWPAGAPLSGLVITRHGHALPTQRIEVIEAGHPLPDATGVAAAEQLCRLLAGAEKEDRVLALISGGGSSLLTLPAPGLELAHVATTTAALLSSGASIQEINCVRKHLSLTLGGRLAAACLAPVLTLIVSDVCGDAATHIASGPFAPDPSTYADALAVLTRHSVQVTAPVQAHLERGLRGEIPDTPKPEDPCFAGVENRVVATGHLALEAAATYFAEHGITPVILGDSLAGEAREVAQVMAALVREIRQYNSPWTPPVALLSGGETTVRVRGQGRGGRNAEFLLALGLHLNGVPGVHALAADTDGIDGTEDNAGAFLDPTSLLRAYGRGLNAQALLDDNDAYRLFATLDDLLITGPTRTNVNDYRAILIA